MRTAICDDFGIEFPIFAFSHCRDVVAAVSRAGGLGVLGALAFSNDQLEVELAWIDEHVDGKPYGVDVVMPASAAGADLGGPDLAAQLDAMIPEGHRRYVEEVLERHHVPPLPDDVPRPRGLLGWTDQGARSQVEVAMAHPIKLLVSALGPPPSDVVQRCRERGIKVAALVGSAEHARKQVAAGVDVVVASGYEAGGHTGEISTMVLVPEVVDAVHPVPVLAAGGIGDGRQVAAALALGAQGAWTGSIWLTTTESDVSPIVRDKLLGATSRDTVRSRALTGKPARQLRTPWTDAWDDPKGPGPLPMPLQFMLTAEAQTRIGRSGNPALAGSPVGQIVGRMNSVRSTRDVVFDLVEGTVRAIERLNEQTSAAPSRAGGS
ncbi:MAG TPA: nitronate monooxygenase family protein [Candidatus Dormibacteraeota bacterium]|nr:nitronate monooxygenase family protein [Candidatus Dormibacteraeota bacterium]